MPIETISPTAGAGLYTQKPTSTPKQEMDGELFLNLLVTQLRNQDPSSPMDTTQMIAQTSQLASMEQLTSLNKLTTESFSLQMRIAAANLIGKEASYTDADGTTVTGIVSSASFASGVPQVSIGGVTVPLDAIAAIGTPQKTDQTAPAGA